MADNAEEQASLWLARQDRGLSDAERAALARWLDENTLNRVAYLRLKAVWRRADRLAARRSPMPVMPRRLWRPRVMGAIAAALILAVAGGGWIAWHAHQGGGQGQVYATAVGATRNVRLADGTRMELNTATQVRADVTASSRTVTLDKGEAYFDVVHDARHPFTVLAGNRRITDLGTKFSVYRDGDDVRVMVREGKVGIAATDTAARPVEAQAGQVVVAGGNETLVMAKPVSQIADALSWREGMLVFRQQPLAEVAEQFNRYNARQIVVQGDARNMRIGGSFKAANVNVFVLLLHRGFGLTVDDRGDRIIVSR